MIIKKYHSKSPQNQSLCCIQNGDISLNAHSYNNCINTNRFYTPRRFTLLCVKPSGYAGRWALGIKGGTLEMISEDRQAEDRRKEYESLRSELRGSDISCQIIVATLATLTGAIIIKWDSTVGKLFAGITIQVIWLFGIMYFAERRFAISRIAKYIREYIELNNSGFRYETTMKKWSSEGGDDINQKRPRILLTPLYREIFLGVIVSIFIPFIYWDLICANSNLSKSIWFLTLLLSVGIAVVGITICKEYKKFNNR